MCLRFLTKSKERRSAPLQLALLSANHTEKVSDKDEKTYEPAHEAAHVLLGVFAFIPVLVGVVDCVVELFNKFGDLCILRASLFDRILIVIKINAYFVKVIVKLFLSVLNLLLVVFVVIVVADDFISVLFSFDYVVH